MRFTVPNIINPVDDIRYGEQARKLMIYGTEYHQLARTFTVPYIVNRVDDIRYGEQARKLMICGTEYHQLTATSAVM